MAMSNGAERGPRSGAALLRRSSRCTTSKRRWRSTTGSASRFGLRRRLRLRRARGPTPSPPRQSRDRPFLQLLRGVRPHHRGRPSPRGVAGTRSAARSISHRTRTEGRGAPSMGSTGTGRSDQQVRPRQTLGHPRVQHPRSRQQPDPLRVPYRLSRPSRTPRFPRPTRRPPLRGVGARRRLHARRLRRGTRSALRRRALSAGPRGAPRAGRVLGPATKRDRPPLVCSRRRGPTATVITPALLSPAAS